MNFMKTLPIHILAKKIKFWERLESKCNLSNTYDGSANFSDSPKVWQMKLRLWHGILPKNGQCLLGTKKSKIMPNVGFELFLSLPFTFPVLVNENPCQIYTENNQISIFNFFPPKFGALPILQECPHCWFVFCYKSHISRGIVYCKSLMQKVYMKKQTNKQTTYCLWHKSYPPIWETD